MNFEEVLRDYKGISRIYFLKQFSKFLKCCIKFCRKVLRKLVEIKKKFRDTPKYLN